MQHQISICHPKSNRVTSNAERAERPQRKHLALGSPCYAIRFA